MRTILAGLVLLAACGGAAANGAATNGAARGAPLGGSPVTVTPLVGRAALAGVRYGAPARVVVRSADALADLWAKLYAGLPGPPAPPAVDFAREMVLFAALGTRPTGGFGVSIARAAVDGGVLRAEVVETRPGAGCMTTQAITYPLTLVRVARHDGDVEFVERVETNDCR